MLSYLYYVTSCTVILYVDIVYFTGSNYVVSHYLSLFETM